MPSDRTEFLDGVLKKMMTTTTVDGKTPWHTTAAKAKPVYNDLLLMMTAEPFESFLLSVIDQYVSIAIECFPQQAQNCKSGDLLFVKQRRQMVKERFVQFFELVPQLDNFLDDLNIVDNEDDSNAI